MNLTVIHPEEAANDNPGWLAVDATCLACKSDWAAVLPAGTDPNFLECPRCHAFKGALKRHIVRDAPSYTCRSCGEGYLWQIVITDGVPCLNCTACGDFSNALDLFSAEACN